MPGTTFWYVAVRPEMTGFGSLAPLNEPPNAHDTDRPAALPPAITATASWSIETKSDPATPPPDNDTPRSEDTGET